MLTSSELTIFLLTIGSMLILARILAKSWQRYYIPVIVAEVLAGIILGPTFLGHFFPEIYLFSSPIKEI